MRPATSRSSNACARRSAQSPMRARRSGSLAKVERAPCDGGGLALGHDPRLVGADQLADAVHRRRHHRQAAGRGLVGGAAEGLVDGGQHEQVRTPVAALDLVGVAEEAHAVVHAEPVGQRRVGLAAGADDPQQVRAGAPGLRLRERLDRDVETLQRAVLLVHEQRDHGVVRSPLLSAEAAPVVLVRAEAAQVDATRHDRHARSRIEAAQVGRAALRDCHEDLDAPEPPALEPEREALPQPPAERAGAALDRVARGRLVVGRVAERDRVEIRPGRHHRHRADRVDEVRVEAGQAQAAAEEEGRPAQPERVQPRRRHRTPVDERAQLLVEVHRDDREVEAVATLADHALELAAQAPAHERDARAAHERSTSDA